MTATGSLPLGAILIERGLITPDELTAALAEQQRTKSRLGDILTGNGSLAMFTLYQALADHCGLAYANLLTEPCDETLLDYAQVNDYIRHRILPWKRDGGAVVLATSEPSGETHAWALRQFGQDYRLAVTSPFDIRSQVERQFGHRLEEESRLRLYTLMPDQSARFILRRDQKRVFCLLLLALLTAFALEPAHTVVLALCALQFMYSGTMLFKWLVFRVGLKHPPQQDPLLTRPPPPEESLPVYTLLVPLYKEKESLARLLAALRAIDYPQSKLDIKLVLEADDRETIDAAIALKPAWNVDIIRVPASEPRTKPKALNYALRFARGEYVTVYDAEDAPDALQLKKAVSAFNALPLNVACLQSRLNYYNADTNLLTRWFAIEYGILFNALMPGLQALQIPLPLGGTSNHLSLELLRRLGEWDPYNVTEDADLGVRLCARGLRTVVMDSITMEEAPAHLMPWVRQRSRWIKGYMQTWLVHMRDPLMLWRKLGLRSFLGFQFFVGLACVSYMTAPLVWLLSLLSLLGADMVEALVFPPWLLWMALFNLGLHFAAHWEQARHVLPQLAGYAQHKPRFWLAALFFPFYWVLHSLASYKSLWQLVFRPHFWEKTSHGKADFVLSPVDKPVKPG